MSKIKKLIEEKKRISKEIFAIQDEIAADGCADLYCSADMDLPIHPLRRLFWRVRGEIVTFLFGWWWWVQVKRS